MRFLSSPGTVFVAMSLLAIGAAGCGRTVAAESPAELTLETPRHIHVAPGEQRRDEESSVQLSGETAALSDFTLVVDLHGMSRIATVEQTVAGLSCRTTGEVMRCGGAGTTLPLVKGYAELDIFDLTGLATTSGETTVSVEVRAGNASGERRSIRVIVGEGGDVAAEGNVKREVRVGGSVAVPVSVRNLGSTTVEGVVLAFGVHTSREMSVASRFGNCYLDDQPKYKPEPWWYCKFDTVIAPGERYRLSAKLEFDTNPDAPTPTDARASYAWLPTLDYELLGGSWPPAGASRGDGPSVKLEKVSGKRGGPGASGVPDYDTDHVNNERDIEVSVTGENPRDVVPVGEDVSGDTGEVVDLTVGAKNVGRPALEGRDSEGAWAPEVILTVPPGVSVSRLPDGCQVHIGLASTYLCPVVDQLPQGKSLTWTFRLRFDKAVRDAEGTVKVDATNEEGEHILDDVPKNNTMTIRFN